MKRKMAIVLLSIVTLVAMGCQQVAPTPVNSPQPVPVQPTIPVTQPVVSPVSAPSDVKVNTPYGVEYLQAAPLTRVVTAKPSPVSSGATVNVPVITWGADEATIYANGDSVTQSGSIFSQKGLSVKLFREDNFVRAIDKVVSGYTPYLRGTLDMVVAGAEALKDRGIEMEIIYQLSWSTGGDTLTVRGDTVSMPADLKGKTIGAQLYGPHMLYIYTVLKNAGLKPTDVQMRWLRELTIPPYDSKGVAVDPMTAMQKDSGLSAVTVISPDMLALTSGGSVGTGAESSVKGAKLLLSTKTASQVIADVYAVRKDYLDSHRNDVQAFVQGLLLAQEQLTDLYNNRQTRGSEYQNFLKISAQILRDSPQATADIEGLFQDMTFAGYRGNVLFFGKDQNQKSLRDFETLLKETQEALLAFGIVTKSVPLAQANWDYAVLAQGLRDTTGVMVQKFDPTKVEQYTREREKTGATQSGVLFQFEIYFPPNQNEFTVDLYRSEFDKILELASIYPGAIIIVEGHADPLAYLKEQQSGSAQPVLDRTKQAAKNLSLTRAITVRENLIQYAKVKNIVFDPSQFTVVGAGIDRPKYPRPATEQEWRANMRVAFQIVQVEAELDKFSPIGGK
ncbi:MAG: OmpA family protein [Candidatus Nealsonbacteria bacterium]|nr:OmpA family protein [Candidatus Nealsonbacteria bacterium]